MILNLKTEDLKVGMFIDLSNSWMENPFWKIQFEIKSENEISKIIRAGIKRVMVDTTRSSIQPVLSLSKEIELPKEGEKAETVAKKTDIITPENTNKGEAKNKRTIISTTILKGSDAAVQAVDSKKPEGRDSADSSLPLEWRPEKFMPPELVQAIKDKSLPPDNKAKVVQNYSIELMKNLLKKPTAEAIIASKIGISEIVDIILDEDKMPQHLLAIVSHDFYTYTHSVNVGIKSVLLAKRLYKKLDKEQMHELGAGFFLHDIGKVKIDQAIINKPGRLTEEEMEIMRTHPYESYRILNETKQLTTDAWIIAMQHHERDDGKGYPRKLKDKEIHPYARVCSIADVYDALTGKRSYKEAKPSDEALRIMNEEMATHFNKELLQNFIALFKSCL